MITGHDLAEHLSNVQRILERLIKQAGLTDNEKKCSFLKPSVEYLGHRISGDGLHAINERYELLLKPPHQLVNLN